MRNMSKVPITLMTGYLGAGKTTLLNHVLRNQEGYRVAVIVNDIGEINIDADLIERGGTVQEKDGDLVPLSNGCICCTLKTDLIKQLASLIRQNRFDYILIEASGICEPLPIAQTIAMLDGTIPSRMPEVCRLDNIVTVVDAARLVTEFDNGNALLSKSLEGDDIENLLIQQIEFCSTVIINKVDAVTPEELGQVRAIVKKLQPMAKIIETTYANVDIKDIINTHAFDFQKASLSAGWVQGMETDMEEHHEHEHHHEHHHHEHDHEHGHDEEYGISTFIYYRRRPFNMEKLEAWINNWPREIIRCKGVMWMTSNRNQAYMFEQAGRQIQAVDAGSWLVAAPKAQQKEAFRNDPKIKENWDPVYGDRMIKLVFIGKNMDKEAICSTLDACLDK